MRSALRKIVITFIVLHALFFGYICAFCHYKQISLLHYTCNNDYNLHAASWLLVHVGADVNARDAKGKTPLMYAALLGDHVRLLLSHGADPNLCNHVGITALHQASYYGHETVVTQLLRQKININARTSNGRTPLLLAVAKRRYAVAKLLVAHGADVSIGEKHAKTPLYFALRNQDFRMISLLVRHGADVSTRDNAGCTALHFAAEHGDIALITFLLAQGRR